MKEDVEIQTAAALQEIIDLQDARIEKLVKEVDGLIHALDQRATIEQAKGVIMSTMRCSADAAFAVLVAQSQAQNRKLREIADEIASSQDRRSPA